MDKEVINQDTVEKIKSFIENGLAISNSQLKRYMNPDNTVKDDVDLDDLVKISMAAEKFTKSLSEISYYMK